MKAMGETRIASVCAKEVPADIEERFQQARG